MHREVFGRGSLPSFYGCSGIWREYGPAWYARMSPQDAQRQLESFRVAYKNPQKYTSFESEPNYYRANSEINICVAEHILGKKSTSTSLDTPKNQPNSNSSIPGKSPQELQREREAQARADAAQAKQRAIDAKVDAEKAKQREQRELEAQARTETQQAQQRGRDAQVRADAEAQREGRRSHDVAAQAHECVGIDKSGNFGGLTNNCGFAIEVEYCNYRPKKDSWAAGLECKTGQRNGGGLTTVGAGKTSANHVKNTQTVFFFACKKPAWPKDVIYVEGKGLSGRCG